MGLLSRFFRGSDKVADHRAIQSDRRAEEQGERVRASADRAFEVARRLEAQLAVMRHREPQ